MKLPLKARILQYAISLDREFTLVDIIDGMKKEYAGERIFSEKRVEEYFNSYLGVGFFRDTRLEVDGSGTLIIYCTITEYGKERAKYIPAA